MTRRSWYARMISRWDAWVARQPWYVILPLIAVIVPLWLVSCFVVFAWLIDFITRVWP
jgi:hypothetical protein